MNSLSPELIRELIRIANRDGQDANGVLDLLRCGEWAKANDPFDVVDAEDIFEVWKGSFDDPLEP